MDVKGFVGTALCSGFVGELDDKSVSSICEALEMVLREGLMAIQGRYDEIKSELVAQGKFSETDECISCIVRDAVLSLFPADIDVEQCSGLRDGFTHLCGGIDKMRSWGFRV